jgi:hypothetical protein
MRPGSARRSTRRYVTLAEATPSPVTMYREGEFNALVREANLPAIATG